MELEVEGKTRSKQAYWLCCDYFSRLHYTVLDYTDFTLTVLTPSFNTDRSRIRRNHRYSLEFHRISDCCRRNFHRDTQTRNTDTDRRLQRQHTAR